MTGQEYKSAYNNSWALVVGINNYKYAPHLEYACNDAAAVAETLISSLGFPSKHVIVLKDAKATKDRIFQAYLDFHNTANDPNDRILVFFAGHGHTKKGKRENVGFLVPVDGKGGQPSHIDSVG